MRADFYHLTRWPLESALPRLMERVLSSGQRAVIKAGSPERLKALSSCLWTADPASWIPHGTRGEEDPELQPLWLTTEDENPNGAEILVLTDGQSHFESGGFTRVLDLFNGQEADAVAAARERWRALREAGSALHYWQQTPEGKWEEKAARGDAQAP